MSIRLITFDLDDTLWNVAPVIEGAEAELRDWLGRHAPLLGAVPIEHLWPIRARLVESEPALKHRISELRQARALSEENARLKRIVADQAVQIDILKAVNAKKW